MIRRDFLIGSATAGVLGRATAGEPPREGGRPKGSLKIAEVQVYLGAAGGRHPVMVRVLTDAGVSGVGEAALFYGTGATAAAGMIKDLAEQFLLGRDPFPIEATGSPCTTTPSGPRGRGRDRIRWDQRAGVRSGISRASASASRSTNCSAARSATSVPRLCQRLESFTCVSREEFARAAERVVRTATRP